MPHFPKPYYKANRRTWYVEVGRVQHPLGRHPDGVPEPKKGKNGWDAPEAIRQAYHQKMAELSEEVGQVGQPQSPVPANPHPYVACVIDDFVGWLRKRVEEGTKEERTLRWYVRYLTSFLEHLRGLETPRSEVPAMTVDQLLPEHVYGWVDAQDGWKNGRRGAIAVQRAFNWAAKAGKLRSLGAAPRLPGSKSRRRVAASWSSARSSMPRRWGR